MSSASDKQRFMDLATRLRAAEKPIRILRSVAWSPDVGRRFLANKGQKLPEVTYEPLPDLDEARGELRKVVADTGASDHPVDRWLRRTAKTLETATRLLDARGTPAFFEHSRALYGAPRDPLADQTNTSLDLAQTFNRLLDELAHVDLGLPDTERRTARGAATALRKAATRLFGERAPTVEIVDHLSANALAGPNRIRVRRGARFSDRYVQQLIHHEVYIHVVTALNGRAQGRIPILGASHPGTTRTQEGLAVFAEFISGTMELERLRRLANRVVAIEMARDGADFIQVYRFFLEHSSTPSQAFDNTRRVFRGGVLTGGAPFTKDIVYLDGLVRVHNFLRVTVAQGRADCLRLLFCGKLALRDMPAICELTAMGLCEQPRFLPPWARDLRFLLAYLAYSGFLNRIKLDNVTRHFEALMADAPRAKVSSLAKT